MESVFMKLNMKRIAIILAVILSLLIVVCGILIVTRVKPNDQINIPETINSQTEATQEDINLITPETDEGLVQTEKEKDIFETEVPTEMIWTEVTVPTEVTIPTTAAKPQPDKNQEINGNKDENKKELFPWEIYTERV